jgi:phospholipase/carboxylesterase
MQKKSNAIIAEPPTVATASVIWLHGLGADGNDFANLLPQLKLPSHHSIRFIFPHAPVRPVSINAGLSCRAWFDIYSLTDLYREDSAGIQDSRTAIEQLIQDEIDKGVEPTKIVLAGFSQGGAMALYTGLKYIQPLAGILALSCFLPLAKEFTQQVYSVNKNIPILMIHGSYDDIIPIIIAQKTKDLLKNLGYPVVWYNYPMRHEVCFEQISVMRQWLLEKLRVEA